MKYLVLVIFTVIMMHTAVAQLPGAKPAKGTPTTPALSPAKLEEQIKTEQQRLANERARQEELERERNMESLYLITCKVKGVFVQKNGVVIQVKNIRNYYPYDYVNRSYKQATESSDNQYFVPLDSLNNAFASNVITIATAAFESAKDIKIHATTSRVIDQVSWDLFRNYGKKRIDYIDIGN